MYIHAQTSHAMCVALNVVQTSHSFGDVMLLAKANESKQVCLSCTYSVFIVLNIVA